MGVSVLCDPSSLHLPYSNTIKMTLFGFALKKQMFHCVISKHRSVTLCK